MPDFDYQIATAWDDTGSLANIESIAVPGAPGIKVLVPSAVAGVSYYPHALGDFELNEEPDLEGGVSQNGYNRFTWNFLLMSTVAFDYYYVTYGQGSSNNGKCTTRSRVRRGTTYDNYNTISRIIFQPDLAIFSGGYYWYQDVQIVHTIKETL